MVGSALQYKVLKFSSIAPAAGNYNRGGSWRRAASKGGRGEGRLSVGGAIRLSHSHVSYFASDSSSSLPSIRSETVSVALHQVVPDSSRLSQYSMLAGKTLSEERQDFEFREWLDKKHAGKT